MVPTSCLSLWIKRIHLAEITHKRRMSALRTRWSFERRAGFEVRDVHYTHYGRFVRLKHRRDQTLVLISSLCVHAKINSMGFIETPYRKVTNGKVEDGVTYLSAEEEDDTNMHKQMLRLIRRQVCK